MPKTLLDVLKEHDIKLTKSSEKWRASCPFHEGDRTPSFFVYPDTDTYFCFACHVWGDAIKFLVDYANYETAQAFEYVGKDYKQKKRRSEVVKVRNTLKSYDLLARAANQYHEYLMQLEGPLTYIRNRGIEDRITQKYRLGYTDGAVLQLDNVEDFSLAVEAGLVTRDSWEILSHRITIPNFVDHRTADFMIGRTVIKDPIKYVGVRVPKPVMGFFEVRQSPVLFLVEGQFDWLLLRQWDYPAVVMSGNRISKPVLGVLKDKFIIVVPDKDEEGLKAAQSLKDTLPHVEILDWDDHKQKDISAMVMAGYGREEFDQSVKEHLWKLSSLNQTWEKYLPPSITTELFPSTLKLLV